MILIACEVSGIVRDAFAARGHDVWSCDLLHTKRSGNHIRGDVLDVLSDGWDMMIAFPPCTFLCVTANRWMAEKYRERFPTRVQDRKDAIEFFMRLVNAPIPKIAIENPVGVMSSHYRQPDQYVQPYWFGHPESKKTGLWLKNLPLLIPTQTVEPKYIIGKDGNRYSRTHYVTKGSSKKLFGQDRDMARGMTYQGFADAMADQWGAL